MKWELRPISELCVMALDCVNKTAPLADGVTPYKMLRTTNIKSGFIDFNKVRYVEEGVFKIWTRRAQPQYGDVIFTREAPAGEVGRFTSKEGNYFLGQRLFLYRPDPSKLDWNYLAYILQSPQIQGLVSGIAYGATVPHMAVSDMENLKIPVPSLQVQKKIGDILSAYDDLIENNLKRIKILEEMAQITYEEWFVRLNFPGHEDSSVDPDTDLPVGWKKVKCFDAMEVLSGGTPKTGVSEYWDGDIPFYTPKDAVDEAYVFETEKYVTEFGVKKCNSKLYPTDTVFITARGTVGKVNLAGVPMAMNQSCYALRGRNGMPPYFLYFSVKASVEAFKGASNGGVFNTIVVDTFKFLPFTLPPTELVHLFNQWATPIMQEISALYRQNIRLREARNILLPRLITGVIDVESYNPAQLLKEAA